MNHEKVFASTLAAWPDEAIVRLFEWVGNDMPLKEPAGAWSKDNVP